MCTKPVIHKRFSLLIGSNDVRYDLSYFPQDVGQNVISDGLTNRIPQLYEACISKSFFATLHIERLLNVIFSIYLPSISKKRAHLYAWFYTPVKEMRTLYHFSPLQANAKITIFSNISRPQFFMILLNVTESVDVFLWGFI